MPYNASTALFDTGTSAFGFLLIFERLLGFVVVDLAFFLRRLGRGPLFALELRVVQLPGAGQRFRANYETRADPAHVDVGLVVLSLVEPLQDARTRRIR